jgi:triosephosphate isomerase
MIFVNFKTYQESTGENALFLLKKLEEVVMQTGVSIIPIVQALDIKESRFFSQLPIWVQHIDPVTYGAHTGSILAEAVAADGATGTILNHSEHKFASFEELTAAVTDAKKNNLETLIFASDVEEVKKVAALAPDYIGYEPPELIGSKDTSVAKAKPDVIEQVVEAVPHIPIIVGAGVKDQNDVRVSLELGAKGVALASGVILAPDQKAVLMDLAKGYSK